MKIKVLNSWPKKVDKETLYAVTQPFYVKDSMPYVSERKDYICIHRNLLYFTNCENKTYEIVGKVHCYHSISDKSKRNINFSVGDDLFYYKKIKLFDNFQDILYELHDIVFNNQLYDKFKLDGYAKFGFIIKPFDYDRARSILIEYDQTSYINFVNDYLDLNLEFNCSDKKIFTDNIHAFIGKNGSGKTYLMHNMILGLVSRRSRIRGFFRFRGLKITKVISIIDNTIDNEVILNNRMKKDIQYSSIRSDYFLKPLKPIKENNYRRLYEVEYEMNENEELKETYESNIISKNMFRIFDEFSSRKKDICLSVLQLLLDDFAFAESKVVDSINKSAYSFGLAFKRLSNGHKKIIYTIISMINEIENSSMIFFDEPEANLYPGLLSLYIKCIKYVLNRFHSLCFVFTHSPVIIQQLPQNCVWKIERTANYFDVKNIVFNSLGENVGKITRELFGIELEKSLYYDYIEKASNAPEENFHLFGKEAQSILYRMEKKNE